MSWIKKGKETTIEEVFFRNIQASSLDDINSWFKKSYDNLYRIDRMDQAVELAQKFKNQPVTIVGDYDADGVTSTSILLWALRAAGFSNVRFRIPKRFSEGFGLNPVIIDEIDSGLVITCDNGIAQIDSIQKAKDKGLTVIVIDHHLPVVEDDSIKLPPADIIIDPNAIEGSADFSGYCGAGLCLKFARTMLGENRGFCQKLQCLAAIGTVADVMELREENYVIVRNGLKMMLNSSICPPGLYALICEFTLNKHISAKDIGFKIAPAINAASRMADNGASEAVNLLTFSGSYFEGVHLAQNLIATNEMRKSAKKNGLAAAEAVISEQCLYGDCPLIVNVPDIPEGIIGILAGSLCEKYKVPSIVVSKTDNGVLKGSARSCGNYDMKSELDKCSDFLLQYGGHTGAAGLSLSPEKFDEFRQVMMSNADGFVFESTSDHFYDLEIDAKDISNVLEELSKYEPFGEGNPEIRFLIHNFSVVPRYGVYKKLMGADSSIVKIYSQSVTAIGFDMAEKMANVEQPKVLDMIGVLSTNYFGSNPENQLEFEDFKMIEPKPVCTPLAETLKLMATSN